MPHFSSNSFLSSRDGLGYRHTHSIDFCVFQKKNQCSIYKCRARSDSGTQDPRDGAVVLAKFLDDTKQESSETWTKRQVEISKIAQQMAKRFNKVIAHLKNIKRDGSCSERSCQNLEFEIPQTSKLDSVSMFDRKRKKDESFIVVNDVNNFQTFICTGGSEEKCKSPKGIKKSKSAYFSSADNISGDAHGNGRIRSNSEGDAAYNASRHVLNWCCHCKQWCNPTRKFIADLPHQHLHAFIHYFFSQTNGQMAIDCLEGEYDKEKGYKLTVPVIHSVEKRFGINDCGTEGIRRVVENHVCTDLCKHLNEMSINPTSSTPLVASEACFASHHCHYYFGLYPTPHPSHIQDHNRLYPDLHRATQEAVYSLDHGAPQLQFAFPYGNALHRDHNVNFNPFPHLHPQERLNS